MDQVFSRHAAKEPREGGRPAVVAALAASMLLASLGTSIANIALPALAADFAAPFSKVQAVVVAYLAALTISVVIAGRLGDRFGMKRMLVAGLALFTASSILCAAAPGLWMLVAARGLQGVGAAFMMTLSMAMMRQVAAETQVGRAMGLLGTVSAVGTALGPALGGLLMPASGWRGIFWVQAPLAFVALLLVSTALASEPAIGRRVAPPMRMVLGGPLMANLAVNLVVAAVMMTTLVVGPFYLGLGAGLDARGVGLVMAIGPAVSILSGVPSGRLVDRLGSGRVLTTGLLLVGAGAFLIAFLPAALGLAGYVLAILVITPGYQLFQAANNTAALAALPADRRGVVSGLLGLSRNLGLIAGASLMGAVFAAAAGTQDITHAGPEAIAAGMRWTFALAGGSVLVAIGATFSRRIVRRLSHDPARPADPSETDPQKPARLA